ncbi:pre-mRNA-processing protein 40C isoform X2 [Phalaenopsis equestris]|uniref:pre-mRNA-processing protein 40C isoform X2 n=1 Tax=Phalaenopsis equestris TaxID=78828 RepID=UPI0009E65ACF|nr:pre-mRNA-processing protein 40C isoform X2 [Phalaenopsis equestris]
MSSELLVVPEAQVPALSMQSETAESTVSKPTCSLTSSEGGPSSNVAVPVTESPTINSGSEEIVTVSPPPMSSPAQRAIHGTASDSLQDSVRAKFVSSPGYVVPPPSFSYSIFPRVNFASGAPQQTSSSPALKLTPQMSPAALQPPVPGQSLGNRPSFSYSVVPLPNASPVSGQQFQPAAVNNQRQLLTGNSVPPSPSMAAACLQPQVPCQPICPDASISATVPQNFPPPIQLPVPPPKGQLSPSTNFSFGGGSRPTIMDASVKYLPSNTCTSDATPLDIGMTSVSASLDSKVSHDKHASSSIGSTISPISNVSSMLPPTGSLINGHLPMVEIFTDNNLPKTPNPATVQPAKPGTSSATMRPIQHNQVLAPSSQSSITNPTPPNVPQQIYPHLPSMQAQILPSHAHWLPPQATGVQCLPLSQYPAVLPGPSSFSLRGMPPPSVPFPDVRPPGVFPEVNCGEASSSTLESSFPVMNTGAGSPHDAASEKEVNDTQEDGNSKSEELEAWTMHRTETGVLYYYNTISGESTYERPSKFKGEPEKIALQIIPVSWEKLSGTNWSLVTTNDLKKYYYNTVNKVSSWQVPAEVLEMRKKQVVNSSIEGIASIPTDKGTTSVSLNAPALQTGGRDSMTQRTPSGQASTSALDLIKKKLQDSATPNVSAPLQTSAPSASDLNGSRVIDASAKAQQLLNSKDRVKDANGDGNMSDSSSDSDDEESGPTKEECIDQFKEMLKERGVAPFSKWEKELPKIVFDPRFKAVPSYSARRAIFEQYVRTRAEEERKEKKAAQKAAIIGFKQLLEEALEDMTHRPDYQTFKRKWGDDPRFEAIERKEREFLFNEKVLLRKKAAEEKIHAERAASMSCFKSMLKERQDISSISRWSKVKDNLRNDPRYKTVNHEEREALFNEYMAELRAVEQEAERAAKAKKEEQDKLKEREREMRKRKEREEQEMERIRLKVRRKEAVSSYQALLVETIKDLKASWTESKPKLEKDPQGRATNPDLNQADAEKLFRDHVKDLYERCARDYRALLAEIITSDSVARSAENEKNVLNSWSEAKRVLKPDPRYSKMPRKDRESLWLRFADSMMRKQKAGAEPKDKFDSQGKNRSSTDNSLRGSPRGSRARR